MKLTILNNTLILQILMIFTSANDDTNANVALIYNLP